MTSQNPQIWALQDAKARFSELFERCLKNGAQKITRRGKDALILIPEKEWQRLQASSRPTLKDVLLSEKWWTDDEPMDLPPRGKARRRPIIDFSE
jgi:prevent-host-death family protein